MGTDYSDAAKGIVKVHFPPTQQLSSGAWGQRWRVETDVDIPTERAILDSAERAMGQDAFEVRIDLTGRRSADLLVTLRDDPAQGRFLYAIYNALKAFDHMVARISSVEDQPREHWTPLREWATEGK
jgi:hypothetical protein